MFEKLEKFQITILSVVLAAGLICATKIATTQISKDVIAVTGSSYKTVTSDSGRLEFEISARSATKGSAYEIVNKQLPQVKQYLLDKGIKENEIEIKTSSGYNSYKQTPNGNTTNEIAYYNLSQPLTVSSNDVQKIKEISIDITNLINKGIDINVYQPAYFYSKLSDMKVQMLEEATKDAKQRADAMLKATHNRTGKIQSVRMGVFQITPVDSTNVSDMGISDTSTIEKKITSVANVTFQIK
ncbi:MAG: SIMPL domain-containing protein [Brachyspira sp.]|jgi:hypothetical protein|nr:SIMPL domain-containing protein [Brachyspira sp.]